MRIALALLAALVASAPVTAAPLPIIDVHLHAEAADEEGPPGQSVCAPYDIWPARDPGQPIQRYLDDLFKTPGCAHPIKSGATDKEVRDISIAKLELYNITAIASGMPQMVEQYRQAAPDRIIPAVYFGVTYWPTIAELRALHAQGRLKVLGELLTEYGGKAPNDPKLEPYYALAEELDIPVAIHVGPGFPGTSYVGTPDYRARNSSALLLEDVLVRHPRMRLYVMHAGWPLGDDMVALMYAHPQVYADIGAIDWVVPKPEFRRYLKRLIDAGFEKRIMWGSDQMVWPDTIDAAVAEIADADYLTDAQKRDILYNNAAHFFRLKPGEPPISLAR
jgi:predicted TIM-barrel fold metal-dependent hydrolase